MIKDQVKAVLERVSTWPEPRQRQLAKVALEIEAELAGAEYDAIPDELAAIDEDLAGEAAKGEEGGSGIDPLSEGTNVVGRGCKNAHPPLTKARLS